MIKLRNLKHRYLLLTSDIPVRRATRGDPVIALSHSPSL
jgi:hypothetical protein